VLPFLPSFEQCEYRGAHTGIQAVTTPIHWRNLTLQGGCASTDSSQLAEVLVLASNTLVRSQTSLLVGVLCESRLPIKRIWSRYLWEMCERVREGEVRAVGCGSSQVFVQADLRQGPDRANRLASVGTRLSFIRSLVRSASLQAR